MGDIRNKIAKIQNAAWQKAAAEAFLRAGPYKPSPAKAPAPPRCQCGLTPDQVPTFWAVSGRRLDPTFYYCPACAPVWVVRYMLASTVNDPAAYEPGDEPK